MTRTCNSNIISLAVALLVSLCYLLANFWVGGPVHPHDEIGYLNNAAFLAGRSVDTASSYQLGYSIFLTPLFYLSTDPYWVWKGVLAVNSILWGGAFYFLARLILTIGCGISRPRQAAAIAVIALYPGAVVISGYAFSQSAVALLFMAAVWSMNSVDPRRPISVIPHALAVGFLCWIHPSGLAIAMASTLAVAIVATKNKDYRQPLLNTAIGFGLAALYRGLIDPWRVQSMDAGGISGTLHYPAAQAILGGLLDAQSWVAIIGMALGQLSYVIVATFGFAVLGVWQVGRWVIEWREDSAQEISVGIGLPIFAVLSIFGCVAISAAGAAISPPDRIDKWFYGRYVDPVLLPVFAFGLLLAFKERIGWVQLAAAAGVTLVASWLVNGVGLSGPMDRLFMAGFWPAAVMPEVTILLWFMAGALAVSLAAMMPLSFVHLSIAALYSIAIISQFKWHAAYLNGRGQANPSEVVDFVRRNFAGGCVVFDVASISTNYKPELASRSNLYSFYFFDYDYRRSSLSEWSTSCEGPLLTYNPAAGNLADVELVGVEKYTGLRIAVKGDGGQYLYPTLSASRTNESYWISSANRRCVSEGSCLYLNARDLEVMSQVGTLEEDGLATSGQEGYLFFGPYVELAPGKYEISMRGRAEVFDGAAIDVSANRGAVIFAKHEVMPHDGELARVEFQLDSAASDVEIRLWVSSTDKLVVEGYVLSPSQ